MGKLSHGDAVRILVPLPVRFGGGPTTEQAETPTEEGIYPCTGPAWLLPALMASHGRAAGPHTPDTGTEAAPACGQVPGWPFSCWAAGTSPSSCCLSGHSHVPHWQDRGPRQLSQGQAQTCTAMVRTQHHRPPCRGRGQSCPSPQSPAAHMGLLPGAVPRGSLQSKGLPPLRAVDTKPGGSPPPLPEGHPRTSQRPGGWAGAAPPSPGAPGLGAWGCRSPKQQRAWCSGKVSAAARTPLPGSQQALNSQHSHSLWLHPSAVGSSPSSLP